ncbi:hydantoinase B/oxoprolinase family protein [Reyranella sp.]|uniref:hydantoinase B/oxoprolinase family protein n=1 Tax=Reyranella sp. TaxID=1929291 RepID=UPI003BA99244
MRNTVDPFTVEVIRHALTAAAEEMSFVVMRSARSPLLREAGDLSSALTDHKGDLIAQGRDIPIHLGVMSFTVKKFLERVPPERLLPGDVWFLNLPEVGGNHLPDVKAIRPIFLEGRLFAFAVSLAHWGDIGGAWAGSYFAAATETWQEGVRIPPVRLFTAEGPDREKLDFLLANLRGPAEREGDILAQMAATRTADARLQRLGGEHGAATIRAALDRLDDLSEAQMREAIAGLPDGVYEGEDFLDDDGPDGQPAAIRVRIEIAGDRARFDFGATDDAVAGPLNTTPFVAMAAVYYAIKAVAGPEIQPNGGCYRPLEILTRPGSILEPAIDKPVVGGNHETSQRAVDAIMRALEPAVPERLTAGGSTTAGLLIFGGRRRDGAIGTFYETHGGGEGARAERDGVPVVRVHLTNTMNTPAEIVEAEYMIRVEEQRLRTGSGGAGRHRGGDGMVRTYTVLADGLSLTTMFERRIVAPYGLQGGADGAPFRVTLHRAAGGGRELSGKENLALRAGDRVVMETSGGGGYGSPA